MLNFEQSWENFEFVAFDTETSGAYPLGAEIVEFGAVKWKNGQIVDSYQTLLKPTVPMSAFNISIHGITNEMVADAPLIKDKIHEIREFMGEAILMAHHAPFDLGFVAIEFEKYGVALPKNPALCTSLLARKIITESANHKLQTLIGVLGLDRGAAHRAKDDATACLEVGLECLRRLAKAGRPNLKSAFDTQEKKLTWDQYLIVGARNQTIDKIVEAIQKRLSMDLVYDASSSGTRRITPIGLVRSPDGDFVMATCHRDAAQKRFYLQKFKDCSVCY